MTRCSACSLPIERMREHYPFAHQEEYVEELPFILTRRTLPTDWRTVVGVLLSLAFVAFAGRA